MLHDARIYFTRTLSKLFIGACKIAATHSAILEPLHCSSNVSLLFVLRQEVTSSLTLTFPFPLAFSSLVKNRKWHLVKYMKWLTSGKTPWTMLLPSHGNLERSFYFFLIFFVIFIRHQIRQKLYWSVFWSVFWSGGTWGSAWRQEGDDEEFIHRLGDENWPEGWASHHPISEGEVPHTQVAPPPPQCVTESLNNYTDQLCVCQVHRGGVSGGRWNMWPDRQSHLDHRPHRWDNQLCSCVS